MFFKKRGEFLSRKRKYEHPRRTSLILEDEDYNWIDSRYGFNDWVNEQIKEEREKFKVENEQDLEQRKSNLESKERSAMIELERIKKDKEALSELEGAVKKTKPILNGARKKKVEGVVSQLSKFIEDPDKLMSEAKYYSRMLEKDYGLKISPDELIAKASVFFDEEKVKSMYR